MPPPAPSVSSGTEPPLLLQVEELDPQGGSLDLLARVPGRQPGRTAAVLAVQGVSHVGDVVVAVRQHDELRVDPRWGPGRAVLWGSGRAELHHGAHDGLVALRVAEVRGEVRALRQPRAEGGGRHPGAAPT